MSTTTTHESKPEAKPEVKQDQKKIDPETVKEFGEAAKHSQAGTGMKAQLQEQIAEQQKKVQGLQRVVQLLEAYPELEPVIQILRQ